MVEGPDWVKKDGGYSRAIRIEIDGEVFLDKDTFDTTWEAICWCRDNFGKDGYLYVCL